MTPEENPGPRAASGRRDNGLDAASWSAVAEVDPRVVADLLAALAAVGIAAYSVPSPGLVGGYLEMRLPVRPLSRLHVDASRRRDAEAVVRAEIDEDLLLLGDPGIEPAILPSTSAEPAYAANRVGALGAPLSAEDDAAFAAIVAGWDTATTFTVNPWPVSEDADPDPAAPGASSGTPPRVVSSYPAKVVPPAPAEEEHYVAPPPPPLPRIKLQTLLAVLAIIAGAATLITISVVGVGDQLPLVTGCLLIIGGIVGLLAGMREDDQGRDGWDDGAVV